MIRDCGQILVKKVGYTRDFERCSHVPRLKGFDIDAKHPAGGLFNIQKSPMFERTISLSQGEVTLRKGNCHALASLSSVGSSETPDQMFARSYSLVNDALDLLSVRWRDSLVLVTPSDHIRWYPVPKGVKVSVRSSVEFRPGMQADISAIGSNSASIPPAVPTLRSAYRYFRYSQSTDSLYESYRNMFLALEWLMDDVYPYTSTPTTISASGTTAPASGHVGETEWFEEALRQAVAANQIDLAPWKTLTCADGVDGFIQKHYNGVRCAFFHAKESRGNLLLPGDFADAQTVIDELPLIQNLVESLLQKRCATSLASSGMTEAGMEMFLSSYSPDMELAVFEDVPESVLANESLEPVLLPVKYIGRFQPRFREWQFLSDIRCSDYGLRRVAIGMLAGPKLEGLFELQAQKLRSSPVVEDIDLDGVAKLEVLVRCLLRNPMDQRRQFSI